jgi:DNA topoisomerase-3
MIVETTLRYISEKVLSGEESRGPVLPKIVCKREMKEEEVKPFFSEEGKTELMDNFISKRGRPFRGALKRKPTGKHGFEFPPREPRKKAGKKKSTDTE